MAGIYASDGSMNVTLVGGESVISTYLATATLEPAAALTTSQPMTLAQTWNAAGVTFTGFKVNITDTASAAGSLLADFQVGGTSKFSIDKDGDALGRGYYVNSTAGIKHWFAGAMMFDLAGSDKAAILSLDMRIAGDMAFGWVPTMTIAGTNPDLQIWRDAAGILAQRNGVNAQAFRLYNTYTDASNYERGFVRWSTNQLQIGAEAAGTGTTRTLLLDGSIIYFGLSGTAIWQLGGSGVLSPITDNTRSLGATANRIKEFFLGEFQEMSEMTAPSAPAADKVRLYAEDNGAGKTRLMAIFPTGAAQQIAIEP